MFFNAAVIFSFISIKYFTLCSHRSLAKVTLGACLKQREFWKWYLSDSRNLYYTYLCFVFFIIQYVLLYICLAIINVLIEFLFAFVGNSCLGASATQLFDIAFQFADFPFVVRDLANEKSVDEDSRCFLTSFSSSRIRMRVGSILRSNYLTTNSNMFKSAQESNVRWLQNELRNFVSITHLSSQNCEGNGVKHDKRTYWVGGNLQRGQCRWMEYCIAWSINSSLIKHHLREKQTTPEKVAKRKHHIRERNNSNNKKREKQNQATAWSSGSNANSHPAKTSLCIKKREKERTTDAHANHMVFSIEGLKSIFVVRASSNVTTTLLSSNASSKSHVDTLRCSLAICPS